MSDSYVSVCLPEDCFDYLISVLIAFVYPRIVLTIWRVFFMLFVNQRDSYIYYFHVMNHDICKWTFYNRIRTFCCNFTLKVEILVYRLSLSNPKTFLCIYHCFVSIPWHVGILFEISDKVMFARKRSTATTHNRHILACRAIRVFSISLYHNIWTWVTIYSYIVCNCVYVVCAVKVGNLVVCASEAKYVWLRSNAFSRTRS